MNEYYENDNDNYYSDDLIFDPQPLSGELEWDKRAVHNDQYYTEWN